MNETIGNIRLRIPEICKRYAIKSLHLIESGARKELKPSSDIEFLYSYKEDDIVDDSYTDHFFSFKEALQIEFKSKVDLMVLDYLKNPYSLKTINRDKVLHYEA